MFWRLTMDDNGSGSSGSKMRVVIVMDGLKEFSTEALQWALVNVVCAGNCDVILLGAMPWLNLPLSAKTWQDIWAVDLEELLMAKERSEEWMSDPKFVRLQSVVDLCEKFGVVLRKEVVMGFPLKLRVLEKITSLYANWVVFDRHQKKNREFFTERIPCNMIMINENGEAEMIKRKPMIDSIEFTPGQSPASLVPTPQLMISDNWMQILASSPS